MDATSINQVIDKLADKLSVPAGRLMELLPAAGIRSLAECLLSVAAIVVGILCFRRAATLLEKDECEWGTAAIFAGCAVLLVGSLCFILSASDAVLWIYNPQAWSLDYILKKL